MQQWEQRLIQAEGAQRAKLDQLLVRNGAEGWEVTALLGGVTGLHVMLVAVKRPIVAPDPPEGPEGWYPDPCGRFDVRHWNGHAWSAHVANRDPKITAIDAPQTLPASDWTIS